MGLNRIFVCLRSGRIRRGLINRESDWKIVGKKLITRVKHDFALFIGTHLPSIVQDFRGCARHIRLWDISRYVAKVARSTCR